MNAYDSILKFGKAQLNTNQNGEEMICFYPDLLKKGIEHTQFNTQLHPAKTLTDEVQEVLVDVIRLLESQRIWNGMGWHYNLIPPFSYLPVAEKVKAILKKASEK